VEARLVGGPRDRGSGTQERTLESLCSVADVCRRQRAVPDDIERYRRMDWEDRRDGRIGKAEALSKRVRDVVIVEHAHIRDVEFSVRIVKMDPDCAVPDWNHPEDIVTVDVDVVVVDLCGQSNRTGIQVKSNEDERAAMGLAVRRDECALTETHVRLEGHACGSAGILVRSRAAAANVGQSDEPVEVCDLRWVADLVEGVLGIQGVVVNKNPQGRERCNAPGNRIGTDAGGGVVLVVAGEGQLRTQETRS
jgi:hypothetical protein